MKKNKPSQAFTLVELIVVITILAILGTIAFISLQGYSKDTRNSVRLSDLSNINKTLGIQMVTAGKVQLPDNYVEITASGTVLNYQGEAGEKVLEALGVFNGGKDPKDDTYYTYSTNTNRTKYQLLGFLEGDAIASTSLLENTYAVTDLSERAIVVKGDDVGILLDSIINIPVTTTVDVVNTVDTYKITFTDENLIEGTGGILFSNIYNRNEALLDNKEFASLDDSLVGYWDMETLTGGLLKDLSQYGNDGSCYNGGSLVDCGSESGPQLIKGGMNFDGIDDFVVVPYSTILDSPSITNQFTIITKIKPNLIASNKSILERGAALRIYIAGENEFYTLTHFEGDSLGSVTYSNSIYKVGNEYNVSGVYNGENLKIYVNDKLDNSSSHNKTIKSNITTNLYFGRSTFSNREFNGLIYEARIYNRALSEDEIKALYNSTK